MPRSRLSKRSLPAMTESPQGKRLLVVDDEDTIRVLVSRILAAKGYAVASARNGREALAKIAADRPDLVLLDLMMPEIDGWAVLERLRGTPNPPPVLVISACVDRDRALREGAWACLAKPFDSGQLLETCRRILAAVARGEIGPFGPRYP